LLVGAAAEARGRTSDTTPEEHIRRLKLFQQRVLMQEPAERVSEQQERDRAWPESDVRDVGLRLRPVQAAGEGWIPESVRNLRVATAMTGPDLENHPVNDPTGEPGGSCQSEVSIAAFGNHAVAAWNDGEGTPSYQGFGYSIDGGKTWTDGGSPPSTNVGLWASDPVVVVNPTTGAFYYAALCDPGPGMNGVGVVKGTFSGNVFSWGTPKLVRQYATSTDILDKEWLAIDPSNGTLYLSYTHFTGSSGIFTSDRIDFERSTDDNQTWANLQTLSSAQDAGYVQGSRPAVGPDGEVHVVWSAIGQSNRQSPTFNSLYGRDFMRIRKSTNGGVSFGAQVTADSLFSNWGSGAPGFNRATGLYFPGIAVDRSNGAHRGRVYLTWNESIDFYEDNLGFGTNQSEIEPNNTPAQATAFVPGQVLRGASAATSKTGVDLDYFRFSGTQGQTVVFFLDSLDVTLDAAFRLFCNDAQISTIYPTRLGFSGTDGVMPDGSPGLLVYTLPADGIYYLRLASLKGATSGGYRVQTGLHVPRSAPTDDRARDHRDIFVTTSDNGITWNPTVRANDDPGTLDDWLPEVAVSGDGRAHVIYYDWRDAVDDCGGSSNVYLTRSDDGGATWSPGAAISTVRSDWSIGSSNLIPNQGDYISAFGTPTSVIVAWGDFRRGDPDVYAYAPAVGSPPVADAGPIADGNPNTPEGSGVETYHGKLGETIRLDGSGSFDPNGHVVSYEWDFPGGGSVDATGPNPSYPCTALVGDISLLLTVTDDEGLSAADAASVSIAVDAGPDQNVECAKDNSAPVKLGVFDPGTPTSFAFAWRDERGVVVSTEPSPTIQANLGAHSYTLTVTDSRGVSLSDDVLITVRDGTPPVIVPVATPLALWPSDHSYRTVLATDCLASVKDECDPSVDLGSVQVESVSSDEPEDAMGSGDGNTRMDIKITCPNVVELRAERDARLDGRVYTISYAVRDGSGNKATAKCAVIVPLDERRMAVDGPGPGYTVTAACGTLTALPSQAESGMGSAGVRVAYDVPGQIGISFSLERPGPVAIRVYDIHGRLLRNLEGSYPAGVSREAWDGRDRDGRSATAGIYFFRVRTEQGTFATKGLWIQR
jgi:hypothetical protein